ncbi:hypothetical protein H1P_730018 [Hyella patelloides LEGE 07179]|uniref:Uncharacterized protein n=1 Tax=Hyella patelloides LEGE 07179 TaxID=945734 RepID=A0A563W3R2_9CYAN|nr:hypothetical protein [Hyella patelloides]VEP18277.1 hypothetical protein H1P_730018 [Hyella patelloides LEGE 07179]
MIILEQLNSLSCWDYRFNKFDGWRLQLIAGTNLDYPNSHTDEIEFHGVTYIECPTDFYHAKFRLGTKKEQERLNSIVSLESEDTIFVIEAETTGSIESRLFFRVAENVTIKNEIINTD